MSKRRKTFIYPKPITVRRFWDTLIRQVDKSATREYGRTDEGSQYCIPAKFNKVR